MLVAILSDHHTCFQVCALFLIINYNYKLICSFGNATNFNSFSLDVVPEDFQVHIYHSKKDRLWVKQWLTGMLEANRYNVTTNRQAPTGTSRMILVLTPELFDEPFCNQILNAIERKTVLGIKLRDCHVPEEILNECTKYMDLTTTDLSDLTFHITFMFRIKKALKLPVSICSA